MVPVLREFSVVAETSGKTTIPDLCDGRHDRRVLNAEEGS